MHYAGNLLRERAKAERRAAKRRHRRERKERRLCRSLREGGKSPEQAVPAAPTVADLNSPEWFEKMAQKMASATDIGGVNVADIPIGPPADPGPIGP